MSCKLPPLLSYYSDKINIYKNDCFAPLPVERSPPPPSMIIYQPLGNCGQPYQTPTYNPYSPYYGCTCKK